MAMAATNLQADAAHRKAIYRRLQARNRIVGILRIGVPALGLIVLVALIGQIYLSSLGSRFGVGRIEVTRDTITIEAPEYSGVLDNGTTYQVYAEQAQADIAAADQIALSQGTLIMRRRDGVETRITARNATLDSAAETVTIPGLADIVESTGTTGTIADSVFDYATQTLVGRGAVHIDYADGTTLDGVGMTYDAINAVWTFSQADVTLPSTPGSDTP